LKTGSNRDSLSFSPWEEILWAAYLFTTKPFCGHVADVRVEPVEKVYLRFFRPGFIVKQYWESYRKTIQEMLNRKRMSSFF
jgi:hypothetical protein